MFADTQGRFKLFCLQPVASMLRSEFVCRASGIASDPGIVNDPRSYR
jgi:hypothetical protein